MNNFLDEDFLIPVEQRINRPSPVIKNKYDWKIHKILSEAKRVYICPARGGNKLYNQLELYTELMTQKKDIKIIRAEDVKKAVSVFKVCNDKDLYPNSVSPWFNDKLDKYFEEGMKKWLGDYRTQWKPRIITDATIADPAFWKEWQAWHTRSFGCADFITIPEIVEED